MYKKPYPRFKIQSLFLLIDRELLSESNLDLLHFKVAVDCAMYMPTVHVLLPFYDMGTIACFIY